jgi:GMP synthase-like glutamine amidotransferase
MKAHCLQHEPFEGMAAIETWLVQNNFDISFTKFHENGILPAVKDIDWLIIMGGGMSVNDEGEYKWLVAEKKFVRQCIEEGKVLVGICLGSQLIANALGARVYRNNQKEIGWFPIRKTESVKSKIFEGFPNEIVVFHWHGETFDLPAGAELIANSEACKNQIFAIGEKVVGFQCHLETTASSLVSLSDGCRSELIPMPYIQSEGEMVRDEKKYSANMHKVLYHILDKLLKTNR